MTVPGPRGTAASYAGLERVNRAVPALAGCLLRPHTYLTSPCKGIALEVSLPLRLAGSFSKALRK